MLKAEKQNFVKEFNSVIKDKNFLVIAHYKGLTVSEISDLRNQIREKNAFFKVAKNTLARRAIKETNFEKLDKFFVGPTSIAFSDDPVGTSKVILRKMKTLKSLPVWWEIKN